MMVVAVVAILVVGPKDLPKMLRAFGRTMKSIRGLAGDFQKQFEDAVKDADLDEVKNIATGKGFKPLEDIKDSANAFKKEMKDSMAAAEKSVTDALPKDDLPKPTAPQIAKTTKSVTKKAPTKKPSTTKKVPVKKVPAKKAAPKKPTAKKAASAGKTA